ncbi:MAG: hypothetical protein KKA73_21535 [Chloroflexi bacterium]|nr:hypothetical protein [Chloroflexota bacterium]MBU1750277.1 hypothetical protein [Chloroflexota bacterium]MBU1878832.1 hypothetical protein [Chloroflexota bacterium]
MSKTWPQLDPDDPAVSARDLLGAMLDALDKRRGLEHARGLNGIATAGDDLARQWRRYDER